ncbi:MAG: hypothetical protein ACR2PL_25730 [Dehalococcoidia bacterium]
MMVRQTAPQALYRIIKEAEPARADFVSQAVQSIDELRAGRRPKRDIPDDGEGSHMWSGISVFRSAERAAAIMHRFPRIGAAVVRLHLPLESIEDGVLRIEKTGADREHYTLWGTPEDLLACVQA